MTGSKRRVALLAICMVMIGGVGEVQARDLRAWGNLSGGAPFRLECPPGSFVSGFSAYVGAYFDRLWINCASFNANTGRSGPSIRLDASVGRSHGGREEIRNCPSGHAVRSLRSSHLRSRNRLLDELHFSCVFMARPSEPLVRIELLTPSPNTQPSFGMMFGEGMPEESCAPEEAVIGIHGSASDFIDSIGLVCAVIDPYRNSGSSSPAVGTSVAVEASQSGPSYTAPSLGEAVGAPPVSMSAPSCRSGFVWRMASSTDYICVAPSARTRTEQENARAAENVSPNGGPYGPATCRSGYVWREAFAGDVVCVTPTVRDTVRRENTLHSSRVAT